MRSVADDLRDQQHLKLQALSVAERIELARRLADRDLTAMMSATGVGRGEALRLIRERRRAGRRRCQCAGP